MSCYCERAFNPDIWAEPVNALSNLGFLFAALFAYVDLRSKGQQQGAKAILGLIGLLMVVGAGSFLFHTFATLWARLADITPISIFITAYMVIALRRFLEVSIPGALAVSGIVVGVTVSMFLCGGLLPERLCAILNTSFSGSLAYVPALIALAVVGVILYRRQRRATGWVLSALCVYTVSLVLRTFDGWPKGQAIGCMVRQMGEQSVALGTHSLWHILNAVTLYLLLRALIENLPATKSA